METLALSEIQAFLTREYKEMGCSKYYLMQVTDPVVAKNILSFIADEIDHISSAKKETAINLGITCSGLTALGLHEKNLGTFSREFRESMVTDHRSRILGDFDNSSPSNWQWGGPNNEKVDMILLVFGKDDTTTDNYYNQLKNKFSTAFQEVHVLRGNPLPNDKEHFGFKDGISQPAIIGSGVTGIGNNNIMPGEFIMGYKSEYEVFPDTPLLKEPQGNTELLKEDAEFGKYKDLGRNGTYFVLRQLKEDVDGFWNFLNEKTKNEDGSLNPEKSTLIAAKMMGRWPSGAPLVKHPEKDPGGSSDDNDFSYIHMDKEGLKCPFGAHIRRTNPRDHFEESPPGVSLKLTRRHRIMRRIRSYGEDFIGSATHHLPTGEVGLLFGCFNADISKQFEFIQYTWANYPKFKRLYADPDPFIGVKENPVQGEEQNFTIPTTTNNTVITGLKSFVTVKGGAYFFFPSVSVIKFLGTI
ncbi:MAG TPA: Dyp-type peroxidase [Chitinophagaceae bacterium]|nr:Dyp-type peroxidase [Chitinophagaceae bacterium]